MKKLLLFFLLTNCSPLLSNAQKSFCVDVSMNRDTILYGVQDSTGNPAEGSDFILQGPIYPINTFITNGLNTGLLIGGIPAFPSEQIGWFISRGWFIQNPAATEGILALTKQIFLIQTEYEGLQPFQIILSGNEPAALNDTTERAIIGTTDELMTFRGQAVQVNVGKNLTDGFNATFCFEMINLLDSIVSTKTIQKEVPPVALAIRPNPATNQITLDVENASKPFQGEIIIMDLLGRTLIRDTWLLQQDSNSKMINTSNLQHGIYLILLREQNEIIGTQKLVITK